MRTADDDAPERARSNLDRHATYIVAAYSPALPGNGHQLE